MSLIQTRMRYLTSTIITLSVLVSCLALALPSLSFAQASGGNWYVRKGATGSNNGTSWTNAWNEMNQINFSSVACGDTIWIAGGTYTSSLSINKTCTAGSQLYIKRVLSSDPVPVAAAGWSSAYDSQVLLNNVGLTAAGGAYWTLDGRVGDANKGIAYGIKFNNTSDGWLGVIANGSSALSNITLTHIEVIGPACVASGSCTGSNWALSLENRGTFTNFVIDHSWLHQFGEVIHGPSTPGSSSSFVMQYSNIGEDDKVNSAEHEDLIYVAPVCAAMTFIGNRWYSSGNDGIFMDYGGCTAGFVMINNIFFHIGGWHISFGKTGTCGPYVLYNNIFENDGQFGEYNYGWIGTGGCTATTGTSIKNNIFYNSSPDSGGLSSYESYNAATNNEPNGGSCTGCFNYAQANPLNAFTGWVNMLPSGANQTTVVTADFHLTPSGGTLFAGKGTNLTSQCSTYPSLCTDLDGNPRPASGAWTMGPYEYAGGGGGDTTPPTTPANLTATAVSSSQINLSWTASTDNVGVTGYQIYRGGSLLTTVTGTSYSNTGLTASTAYSYTVKATDAAGNVSGSSNTASATTQAGTSVPTATLTANPTSITSGQSSTLTWSSTNATSCTGNGFTASGTSGSVSVSPASTQTYSVTCTGAGGTSPAASATVTVTTGGGGGGTYSIFTTQAPTTSYTDGASTNYELGTKFQSTTAGQITGIRFYKASQESGTHTGHIWSSTGSLLATVTFSGETASGWQTQNLTTPLSISAGTTYTVSVNSAGSYYVDTNGGLASAITNGPLSTVVGGNGTYGAVGVYPTTSWQTSNYYRDVVFSSGGGGTDTTAPSVPAGLTASAVSSSQVNLTWTASTDNAGVTGYKIYRGSVQVGTSATASYSDTGLAASTVYSYTVSANDAAGNNSAQSSATGAITQRAGAASIAVGGRVVTTANLNVRSSASASAAKLGTESIGSLGTVVGGPTSANGYTWWQINYDNGISGWSIGTYLLAAAAGSSPAVGMAQPANNSLTLIQHLMQQVQALSARIQSLQSQAAGAGAAVGN